MDKSYIAPLSIIFVLIGFIAYNWQVLDPESVLKKECPITSIDPNCIVRWRAGGHLVSSGGIDETIENLQKAALWYQLAADKGDEESMFHLGWTYATIAYIARDSEPVRSFRDVAKDINAGRTSVKPSDEYRKMAMEWYKKSAEKGFAPAMNNLAFFYEIGGSEEDRSEIFKWASKSASAGNPMGTSLLEWALTDGVGVERNEELAESWKFWNPKNSNPRDLLKPTLERTMLLGLFADYSICKTIRQAAKDGTPIAVHMDM